MLSFTIPSFPLILCLVLLNTLLAKLSALSFRSVPGKNAEHAIYSNTKVVRHCFLIVLKSLSRWRQIKCKNTRKIIALCNGNEKFSISARIQEIETQALRFESAYKGVRMRTETVRKWYIDAIDNSYLESYLNDHNAINLVLLPSHQKAEIKIHTNKSLLEVTTRCWYLLNLSTFTSRCCYTRQNTKPETDRASLLFVCPFLETCESGNGWETKQKKNGYTFPRHATPISVWAFLRLLSLPYSEFIQGLRRIRQARWILCVDLRHWSKIAFHVSFFIRIWVIRPDF